MKIVELFKSSGFKNVLYDEPVKNHNELKFGGNAEIFIVPENTEELIEIVKFCRNNGIEFLIMGRGSGLLISEEGFKGVIIKIDEHISKVRVEGDILKVEAGANLEDIVAFTKENDIIGLSHLKDIPATVGGAVANNIDVFGIDMKNYVNRVEVLDQDNNVRILNNEEMEFAYRKSKAVDEQLIILDIEFKLTQL